MGDANHIHTLGDYSKPSHEGYRNSIELPVGNNVVPLRSDTIRLVQNGCSFHGLRSEDPNQHLKDFLKLVDSLDLDDENRERTRLRLFQFSLRDQARNWLEHLPAGSITTWEDLTTRFLPQFYPPERTAKLFNDILMFQQHHGESLFVYTAEDDLEVFSTDDLGFDWIFAHNFLTCLQKLSSYTSGRFEVSELAACLEKLHFPALLVMSKFSRICFSFVILEVPLSEYFGIDMHYAPNFLCSF
ncbi:zinc finger, CCHC-type containing protein [Tanacetum coccineum]|uniref:Zinc finger, CCHC-type containing protein n=1 Tax=Tanacetum coccineum TaxID=301880 RepID=A0ABQ5DCN6_9ASTR